MRYKIEYIACSARQARQDEMMRRRAKAFDTAFATFAFCLIGCLLLAMIAMLLGMFGAPWVGR